MRRILVLSLAGALVLAGSVVAVARLAGDDPAPPRAAPSPSPIPTAASPEPPPGPSPGATEGAPPASRPPGPPAEVPPALPRLPAPPGPPPALPDPPGYQPAIVTPRPGMDNVHPVIWRRAEVIGDRTVRIHFESGVEPCSVLDRVEVGYGAAIAISLFEGSDPAFKDAACIMIALFKAVDVTLSEPVNGRPVVDGNA